MGGGLGIGNWRGGIWRDDCTKLVYFSFDQAVCEADGQDYNRGMN